MNIRRFADRIGKNLIIIRYPNQGNRFVCSFDRAETKTSETDGMLTSTFGNGKSPSTAIRDYVHKIKGKLLVFNVYDSECREAYSVPSDLTA